MEIFGVAVLNSTASHRFVIADDHPLFRGALKEAVGNLFSGSKVFEAGGFDELQPLLERESDIDLVLLDLTMPGVRGFSGLLYLRAQFPGVPVVVVSASEERERMKNAGVFGEPSRQIVLTGGGAELTGLVDLASRMFGRAARLGAPAGIGGLHDWAGGRGFAVAAGLLVYPQFAYREHFEPRRRRAGEPGGYFIQVGRWLRESF